MKDCGLEADMKELILDRPQRGFVGTIMTQMFGPMTRNMLILETTELEALFMSHGPKCPILKNNG